MNIKELKKAFIHIIDVYILRRKLPRKTSFLVGLDEKRKVSGIYTRIKANRNKFLKTFGMSLAESLQ